MENVLLKISRLMVIQSRLIQVQKGIEELSSYNGDGSLQITDWTWKLASIQQAIGDALEGLEKMPKLQSAKLMTTAELAEMDHKARMAAVQDAGAGRATDNILG